MVRISTSWKTKALKEREKEQKKLKKELERLKGEGYCYDCKFAYLMQSQPFNPVVAECTINKERQVARVCKCPIKKFEKLEGERETHPMISLK